jgi:hypothetical protein
LELDCHLAEAHVLEAQGETERARQSASAARNTLDVTEYHLRDADVERVEALSSAPASVGASLAPRWNHSVSTSAWRISRTS